MKKISLILIEQSKYIPLLQTNIVGRSTQGYSHCEEIQEQLSSMHRLHFASLLRFCTYKLSHKEKAIDVVADTFLRTWNYLREGNRIENEQSFLFTTARHLIIDEYRKKKCVSLDLLTSSGFEISNDHGKDICTTLDQALLVQELYKLPKSYSTIMVMRYVDDYSVRDISKLIQNSENNVSVKIHRGILKLRKVLECRKMYA